MEKETALEVVLDKERLVLDDREGEAVTDCGGPTTPCSEVERVGVALGEDEVETSFVTDGDMAAVVVSVPVITVEEGERDIDADVVLAELEALDEVVTTGATTRRKEPQRPARILVSEPVFRYVRKISFCAPLVPKDHEAWYPARLSFPIQGTFEGVL